MDAPHLHRNTNTGRLGLGAYGLHPVQCRYCPDGIGFVTTTAKGKPMPLDWWENPAGNIRLVDVAGEWRALVVEQFELFPPDPDTRWMPHFEHCQPSPPSMAAVYPGRTHHREEQTNRDDPR